jgi:hypothetical protein
MAKHPVSWSISLSVLLYRWLLRLGPANFRREYGQQMVQVFRQCCRDAYQRRGSLGVFLLWLPTFSELITGMLAERLISLMHSEGQSSALISGDALSERIRHMLRRQRRSIIIVLIAYVVFGIPWLFYMGLTDPSSQWDAVVRFHPELEVIYKIMQYAGELAFLMLVIGGLPIVYVAFKQALASRRRGVVIFLGVAASMALVFIITTSLVIFFGTWWTSFDHNGGVYAIITLLTIFIGVVTVARAIIQSTLSERVLRFTRVPAILLTLAMLVASVATLVESALVSMDAPQTFGTIAPLSGGGVFLLIMGLTTLCAGVALWFGRGRSNATTPTAA